VVPPRVPDLGLDGGESPLADPGLRPADADYSVPTTALLGRSAAIAAAVARYGCSDCLTAPPAADLWVLRHGRANHLAWRVRLRRLDGSPDTALPVFFVDATDGADLFRYDDLQTLDGTGHSLYSGVVTVETSSATKGGTTTFFLEGLGRKAGTFDFHGTTDENAVRNLQDADNLWDTAAQAAAVDAHFGASRVLDYYAKNHARNGIDGQGGPGFYPASADGTVKLVSSRVHYGKAFNNAFWDGSTMTYGDGDGNEFAPLVALDVAGHEMTHGVTEHSAALTGQGQPGALNESWSDVFGAMVERSVRGEGPSTWMLAEDCFTPEVPGDAIRSLEDPHRAPDAGFTQDDNPDHYVERYKGAGDNGGVHVNSGISSKAFYMLAKGGTHHRGGSVTGIGVDDAARIWYRALTTKMTSSTNFAGARRATIAAAVDLFGAASPQVATLSQTWCVVGVGSCLDYGLVGNGSFEGTEPPWQHSGDASYSNDGNFPNVGTGYMFIGGLFTSAGAFSQTLTIPASAPSARLSFALNVSSGSASGDFLTVEVLDTAGRLLQTLASFTNADRTAPGAYLVKAGFDLGAQRGKTIRLQFRGQKGFFRNTVFRIDDVAIK
jgi:thermolysin